MFLSVECYWCWNTLTLIFLDCNCNFMLPGSPQTQVTIHKWYGAIRTKLAVGLRRLLVPTDGTANSTCVTMDRAAML